MFTFYDLLNYFLASVNNQTSTKAKESKEIAVLLLGERAIQVQTVSQPSPN